MEAGAITHTMTKQLIEDVCLYAKACQGYIYGDVVREFCHRDSIDIPSINIRLDLHLLSTFAQVLSITYDVVSLPLAISTYTCFSKKFVVSCKNRNDIRTIIDVCLLSERDWLGLQCSFDVNILAENSSKHFIRLEYPQLERFPDKMSHIKKRIKDGKFTLLDFSACRSIGHFVELINNASAMVTKGWIMDDLIYGESTWIVNQWKSIKEKPLECRKSYHKNNLDLMTSLNECALCSEHFEDDDIVINTKCNHNFHWHHTTCKGLSEWMMHGNITCPVCRKNAI
jgi:hypothetical protein